jgi:cell division protein FtsI (penicillin-binding protein 3)
MNPLRGSTTVGGRRPVFSEVVQQTLRMLGVQPDMAVRPQIVAQAAEESF